jgi:hypothetical protein
MSVSSKFFILPDSTRPRQKTFVPVNPRGGRGVGIDDQLNGFGDSVLAVVGGEAEKKDGGPGGTTE